MKGDAPRAACRVTQAALMMVAVMAMAATFNAAIHGESPAATAAPVQVPQPEAAGTDELPAPLAYEATFFDALNAHPERRLEALEQVRRRVAQEPDDARAVLLLGIAHLWIAAENPPSREKVMEHLVLARHYLERASQLNPADDRIPSWLLSVELGLAQSEGREADATASLAKLLEHAQRDPCFHSVAYAINVWDGPRERPELAQAQKLLEAAAACNAEDPSVRNMSHWPHNVQGFLVGLSDVALKRGDRARALASLVTAESWPGSESWPHLSQVQQRRREFEERAARFADDDASNDPAFIFERGGPVSCSSCHQGTLPKGP
jgi:hypothetical protein